MLRTSVIVAAITSALALPASATTLLTVEYSGARTGGGVLTGTFGYRLDAVDSDPSDFFGVYGGFFNGVVAGGPQDGVSFSTDSAVVFVEEQATQVFSVRDAVDFDVRLLLFTVDNEVVDFDDLPTSFTVLQALDDDDALISISNSLLSTPGAGEELYVFDPNTFTVSTTVVPLPASGVLLVAGLAGLWLRRRSAIE